MAIDDSKCSVAVHRNAIEWIGTLSGLQARKVFESVDVDSEYPLSFVPRRRKFVINPLSAGRIGTYSDDCQRFTGQLAINPSFDRGIASLRHFFPIVVRRRSVSFDRSHIFVTSAARWQSGL